MKRIALVAFQEQDNLGVGYIASMLIEKNYHVSLLDCGDTPQEIYSHLKEIRPLAVGFSIIFQYLLPQTRDLVAYLRQQGMDCHFCAGGHYPSLRPQDLLQFIPGLDSIAMFEGEYTFSELVQCLDNGSDWHDIQGLAYRNNGSVVVNELRPLEQNLDLFPLPVRRYDQNIIMGQPSVPILAGRGCYYNCSFCSIRQFYSRPPGPLKRLRDPAYVAEEMSVLYHQKNCRIFLFQDDDFPVRGKPGRQWILDFCRELEQRHIHDSVLWKISCRPDEIDESIFLTLREHGLSAVYLGIESGTDEGLRAMNKMITTEKILSGIAQLKALNILFEFGFMLFEPYSDFDSIRRNLKFLRSICGDGYASVTYCKMRPYAGTPIEADLIESGRLNGSIGFEDYNFLDAVVGQYQKFMSKCFAEWINSHDGLLNISRWARLKSLICRKYYRQDDMRDFRSEISDLTTNANNYFIDTALKILDIFSQSSGSLKSDPLDNIKIQIDQFHNEYRSKFQQIIDCLDVVVPEKSLG